VDHVFPTRQSAQHGTRVGGVDRFAERLAVDLDHGVRPEDRTLWVACSDCSGLAEGQSETVVGRALSGQLVFVDIRGVDFGLEAEQIEQRPATG
jgi:hypothetical protein